MWEVAVAHIGTGQFDGFIRDGWEPFGVTSVGSPPYSLYHFRRQLLGSLPPPVPPYYPMRPPLFTSEDVDKRCRDIRAQTLKEVGQWLDPHHRLVPVMHPIDCCLVLNKLHTAVLKGEMP